MTIVEFDKIIDDLNGFILYKDGKKLISLPSEEIQKLFTRLEKLETALKTAHEFACDCCDSSSYVQIYCNKVLNEN